MLTLKNLPLNVDNTFGALLFGGVTGAFISLRAEKIGGNHMIKVKNRDGFKTDEFKFMEEVRLVNPEITSSGIGRETSSNSGVLTATIVKDDSTEKTRWAD